MGQWLGVAALACAIPGCYTGTSDLPSAETLGEVPDIVPALLV